MNLERIMGSRKDTMTLTMECNRSEIWQKNPGQDYNIL